jgi:hypothetical protein
VPCLQQLILRLPGLQRAIRLYYFLFVSTRPLTEKIVKTFWRENPEKTSLSESTVIVFEYRMGEIR